MDTKFHTRMGRLVSYDLDASFTASNQTFSNTQVLDTVGEGVRVGSLTVVDTSTGTCKIVSNELELVGSGSANTTCVYDATGVSRALGKALLFTVTQDNGATDAYYGFNRTGFQIATFSTGVYLDGGSIKYKHQDVAIGTLGAISTATAYQFLCLAGGYDSGSIPFVTGDTVGDFLYGGHLFIKGGAYTNWTRLWADANRNDATLYAFGQIHHTNTDLVDNLQVPTNVLNVDTMFQPNFLDTFTGDNDDNLGGHVPEVIAGVDGVQTLGADLLSGWDFTSGWATTANATIVDLNTFSVTANYRGITSSATMTVGKTYKCIIAGTASVGNYQLLDSVASFTKTNDGTFYFQAGSTALYIRATTSGATVDITTLELYEVTNGWQPYANTWTIQSNTANNSPGLDADIAPDNTCTTDVARTEADATTSWTNDGMATFASDTEGNEPNGTHSLHLVADGSGDKAYTTVTTVIGLPCKVTVIYKRNIATDPSVLRIGIAAGQSTNGLVSMASTTFTTVTSFFVPTATTTYLSIAESGANNNAESWTDTLMVEPVTLNEAMASDDMSLNQGFFDVDVTIPTATTDGMAGLVLCLDSVSSPANFIWVFYNRLHGKVEAYKVVAGVGTALFTPTTATYAAGATLRAIVDYVTATDDVKIKVYYNGALIDSEQTIEDNGIAGNTRHGIMSVDSSNSLDNFTVHNRTDSNWDAEITKATGNIY